MIVDAVLGMDFIGLFDEVRIYPKDKNRFSQELHTSPILRT